MSKNYYPEAIRIFDSLKTENQKHAILLEILKHSPATIAKAGSNLSKEISMAGLTPFEREIKAVAENNGLIHAIKKIRTVEDIGLKEAKERVEYLRDL
jgi:ribosomal protein L7/L12